jgi:hypothetical protein
MITGKLTIFKDENSIDPETNEPILIELTDYELPFIEIAFNIGKRRVYLKFRKSDLDREIKEARSAS